MPLFSTNYRAGKKKNGELMFGSYNGVYIFNPSGIKFDTYAPRVTCNGFVD